MCATSPPRDGCAAPPAGGWRRAAGSTRRSRCGTSGTAWSPSPGSSPACGARGLKHGTARHCGQVKGRVCMRASTAIRRIRRPEGPDCRRVVRHMEMGATPSAPAGALARAWTGFALDLYRQLGAGDHNLVLSPSSVATVLAMVLPGARGATADEISAALRNDLPAERLAEAAGALEAGLAPRPELVELLARAFRAGLRQADFERDPEGARRAINHLIAEQTAGKIAELFTPGSISRDTRLVLTNAIYLQARWREAFDPVQTRPEPFHPLDGGRVEVDMLHREATLSYAKGDGWRAVELPYGGGRLAMDVILPEAGAFAAFQSELDAERLSGALARLRPRSVRLALPKFTFDSSHDLRQALTGLGVRTAFTGA